MGTAKDLCTLPVMPELHGDKVRETYVGELTKVTTTDELKAFIERWRPLYLLTKKQPIDKKAKGAKRFRITENNFRRLLSGDHKLEETLACVQKNRTDEGCKHIRQFSCPGAHVVLPQVLMRADMVAQHYGVSSDLALVQMNGGWGAYEAERGAHARSNPG